MQSVAEGGGELVGVGQTRPDGPGSIKGHPLVRRAGREGLDAATARQVWAATEELTGVEGAI